MLLDEAENFRGTERFELRRRLGAGSFGVVYEVYDREHRAVVALKVLRAPAPDAIARFKREFRTLADLTHPNLVSLHELTHLRAHARAHERELWFFTMERVVGVTLLEHARGRSVGSSASASSGAELSPLGQSVSAPTPAGGPPPAGADGARVPRPSAEPERLRRLVAQLASGLAALHAAGKLHRDVKPSNALVTDGGRVVLLDFGLVTELAAANAGEGFHGTLAYASPEQVAGGAVTEASDTYAVGVILFEALASRPPFEGSALEVAASKLAADAPDLRAFAPDAPLDLAVLCNELLQRDAARRPSAAEIVRRLAPEASPTALRPTSRAPFVGRARELDALGAALDALGRGEGGVCWIHGPSGVGKTALARELLDRARSRGAMVLSGRCYEQERLPYKTLDGVIDALVERWSRREPRVYEDLLPADLPALTRLFPALLGLAGVAGRASVAADGEPHEIRRRAFAAARELFTRLARRERLVVMVDDAQWGDLDGAQLLGDALRSPAPPFLLLCTYRDEDRTTSPALAALEAAVARRAESPAIDVSLAPLTPQETMALAASVIPGAPALPRDLLDAVVAQSAGLPFLVGELVRLAAGTGASAFGVSDGVTTVERVVRARVLALPEDARALLRAVAIAGQPVPRAVLRDACPVADEPTALSSLRGAGLVRTSAAGALVEPYHDRIRETVLGSVPPSEARALHGALAHALEARGDAEPERLANHFDLAGDAPRAATYTERAADRASESLAFDRAARLYARALELSADAPAERVVHLTERRAGVLADAGRSAEAAGIYAAAASRAGDALALELECKAAENLLRAGLIERGVAASSTVLAKLGVALPRSPAAQIAWLALHRGWLSVRGLGSDVRADAAHEPRALLRYDACSALAVALSRGEPLLSLVAHVRSLELALALGEPARLQRSLFTEASYRILLDGGHGVSELRARIEALAPYAARTDAFQALPMFDAFVSYFSGRWREAHDRLAECERFLTERCRGVAWEVGSVQTYLLATKFFLGDLPALATRLAALVRDAEARGDVYQEATLRVTFSFFGALLRDQPARAGEEIALGMARWARPGRTIVSYWAAYAEVEVALYEGDRARAFAVAERLWKDFRLGVTSRIVYLRALTVYLRGRAALATADPARLPFVEKRARELDGADVPWAGVASRFLRAAIARARGDESARARLLEEAAELCDAEGFALYGAVAKRALGRAEAEAWMRASGVASPAKIARTLGPGLTHGEGMSAPLQP